MNDINKKLADKNREIENLRRKLQTKNSTNDVETKDHGKQNQEVEKEQHAERENDQHEERVQVLQTMLAVLSNSNDIFFDQQRKTLQFELDIERQK